MTLSLAGQQTVRTELEHGADLADAHATEAVADIDRLLNRLAENENGDHTTGKRITSAVGVDDLLSRNLGGRVRVHLRIALYRADSRLGTVGDKHGAGHRNLAGRVGNRLRDLAQVLGLQTRGLSPALGLGLVADHELSVRKHLVDLALEELRDERCREVERERTAGILGLLGDDYGALHTVGEEEAANVEELGRVDRCLGVGRLEVRLVELLSGTKVSAQRAVVACDHDSTRASRGSLSHLVERLETLAVVGSAELLRKVIIADTAKVRSRSIGQDVLHCTRSVLSSTASDVGHLVVLDDVLVDAQLLGRGKHRIVGLKAVLLKHGLAVANLHIKERVAEGDKLQVVGFDHGGFTDGVAGPCWHITCRRVFTSPMSEKQDADLTPDVDALLPRLAATQSTSEALDMIAALEKKTRGASDLLSTSRLLMTAVLRIRMTPDVHHSDMALLSDTIQTYSKKHGQLKQAITRVVQLAMTFLHEPSGSATGSIYDVLGKDSLTGDVDMTDVDDEERQGKEDDRITTLFQHGRVIGWTGLDENARLALIETLREVTSGKVFVEVERARVTRMYSDMMYARGDVNSAADALQELAVETFGSLGRREKVEFILEQMRLNLERGDLHRVNMFSRKINTKFFADENNQDLKLVYYELMIRCAVRERKHLDVCKYYRALLDTPRIAADAERAADALKNAIMYLVLSPYDNEQSDLMARVEAGEGLDAVPEYRSLLKCFTTPELMRWPGIESLYGPLLRGTPVFAKGNADAEHRWEQLHARVVEHNIQVVSKYYRRIRLARLAELLDLGIDDAESALADLVTKHTMHARIDRPAGVVDFSARKSDAAVLNEWSSDMGALLRTVEKVSHLVNKEWAVQRAGLVVRARD